MAIQGKARIYNSVKADLDAVNMNVPGNTITVAAFDIMINNLLPADPTCADCRDQTLARLRYIGRYRDEGLRKGRYTGMNGPLIRTYDVAYNHTWMGFYRNKARNAALNDSTNVAHMHHKLVNSKHYQVAIEALGNVL